MGKRLIIDYDDRIRFDKIERTNFEKNALLSVIDRLFSSHRNDKDCSLFESEVYKKYYKDLEIAIFENTIVMELYGSNILRPIVEATTQKEGINFEWRFEPSINKIFINYTD